MSVPRMVAISTRARPPSPRCRGCAAAATPAFPCPRKSSTRRCEYIRKCTLPDGGVQYSSKGGGGRPAISAAAIACLFNAGEYDSEYVPKLLKYCETNLGDISNQGFGHWHYAHYYYAQVKYREGGQEWENYRDKVVNRLIAEATDNGKQAHWNQGYIGPIYTTAINLTILQMETGACRFINADFHRIPPAAADPAICHRLAANPRSLAQHQRRQFLRQPSNFSSWPRCRLGAFASPRVLARPARTATLFRLLP